MKPLASFLSSLCLFIAFATPAWSERIWDAELKRFLTEQEMTHAEVFLTEEEALKIMLPNSERIRQDVIRLTPEKKAQIEERIGWKFPEESFEVFVGETGTRVDGYALIQNTIGKHKPMTYMVGVDQRALAPMSNCSSSERPKAARYAPNDSMSSTKARQFTIRSASIKTSSTSAEPPCLCAPSALELSASWSLLMNSI